ncbi:MAG: D-alanyl-D-alanine carboxypeptidase [Veillonellaceae bacterium]|nr:D-alanyl-D-alanine carboxypeptidase [Veillonellaceae bacterium]
MIKKKTLWLICLVGLIAWATLSIQNPANVYSAAAPGKAVPPQVAARIASPAPAKQPPLLANVPKPVVKSETAFLMVAGTKQVLFDKDGHKIMYPASTTKIMTLITALKHGNLNDTVVVSPAAADVEGSSLDLQRFDRLTLRELLFGLMLVSGNDAAHAVAEHVGGGSYSKFIGWMNEEAERIGALRTHFSNPHGLPDPVNHFTTAYDLALIAAEGFRTPGFEDFVSTPYHTVKFLNRTKETSVVNTNRLLLTYPGANGVKTGTTNAAGRCLVSSARRGDVLLIAVVLNGGDTVFRDSALLLDYGFRVLGK